MWAMAVPLISSAKLRWKSGVGSSRSIPPKPSTVPMRVRAEIVGSRTPLRSSNLDWATLGKFSGHVSRGMSRMGVPNCSARCASHALMAGQRLRVRGET